MIEVEIKNKEFGFLNFIERTAVRRNNLVVLKGLLKTRIDRNKFLTKRRNEYLSDIDITALVDFNREIYDSIEELRFKNWRGVKVLSSVIKQLEDKGF